MFLNLINIEVFNCAVPLPVYFIYLKNVVDKVKLDFSLVPILRMGMHSSGLLTECNNGKSSCFLVYTVDISEKEKDPTSIPLPVGVSLPLGKGREALKPPNASREEGG
jgi:hypothetical protein